MKWAGYVSFSLYAFKWSSCYINPCCIYTCSSVCIRMDMAYHTTCQKRTSFLNIDLILSPFNRIWRLSRKHKHHILYTGTSCCSPAPVLSCPGACHHPFIGSDLDLFIPQFVFLDNFCPKNDLMSFPVTSHVGRYMGRKQRHKSALTSWIWHSCFMSFVLISVNLGDALLCYRLTATVLPLCVARSGWNPQRPQPP